MKKSSKFLLLLSFGLFLIAGAELFAGYASWINSSRGKLGFYNLASNAFEKLAAAPVRKEVVKVNYWPSSPYVPHPRFGWWHKPGSTLVTKKSSGGSEYSFEMSFNSDGTRSNAPAIEANANTRLAKSYSVWVFGDSYLEGYGVNDEVVFSSLLQAINPGLKIKNFAAGGFGNAHALLQLKELKRQGLNPPDAIIIGYGDYYLDRNVASPERMKTYTLESFYDSKDPKKYKPEEFSHPRGYMTADKGLQLELIPLFWDDKRSDLFKTTLDQKNQVTVEILKELYVTASRWGVEKLYLAFLSGGEDDPVVRASERVGYSTIDLRRNKGRIIDSDGVPLDGHPGPLAHNTYARKINKALF